MKIIYGVSGTGKSEYIFNKIKNCDSEKIYIITPEQFSFTAERRLLDTLEEGATLKAEVLSFERMAYRVIKETMPEIKTIGKSSKAMIIYDAITANAKDLNFLGKSLENVDTIIKQITEFKKHNITVESLEKQIEVTKDTYLKLKLKDMLIMYKALNDKISGEMIDENDLLTILAQNLKKSHLFDGATFFIDEFAGFTKQEYSVISSIEEIAKELYITVCTDELRVTKAPEADIFYDNKQTVQSLCKICDIDKENQIKLGEKLKFKNEELSHLEENLYSIPFKKYDKNLEHIKLYLADNQYSEIEYVAGNIVKLVRDKGYRYKDIAVICNNIDTYSSLCKAIFAEYEVPVFIDETKDITQNIFIKYVLSIFEIFTKNWSYEAVFNYIKSGIVSVDNIYELENYCLKWGIQGKKWYEEPWNFEKSKYEAINNTENKKSNNTNYNEKEEIIADINFNKEQEIITKPLLDLKEKLKGKKSAKKISLEIHEFLSKVIEDIYDTNKAEPSPKEAKNYNNNEKDLEEKNKADEITQKNNKILKSEKITKEILEAWKVVSDVLLEIAQIFGEENMSYDQYSKLLKTGLGSKELGQIPQTQDKVIVGDVNRSKSHKVKAVFIIGVNDGVFPSSFSSEGFFNDLDRQNLKQEGFEMAKGTREKMYEENFNIYKAFTTAEENLYISYSASDFDGGTLRKSLVISKLKRIFPNLKEETELKDEILTKKITFSKLLDNLGKEEWTEVYEWYKENKSEELERATKGLTFSNLADKLEKENVAKLYGENLRTSVSKMESFRECPFSYYLKYGLKLSDKEKLDIKPIDTGSFMHDVIDEFFKRAVDAKNMTEEEIKNLVEEIINEKMALGGKFVLTAKYRSLVQRLKRVITKSLIYIVDALKNSSFEVLGTEISFGREGKSPIEIKLEDGRKVLIEGKIDRVDIAKMPDGNYIRIIDYKSSTKDIDLNKVVAGLQLQLITYTKEVCEKEDVKPAGMLYLALLEPKIMKNTKNLSKEEIENIIKENYKMNGLVLADVNIIKAMDNTLDTGKSNIVPVTLNSSGQINYSKSSTVTKEEFEKLLSYSNNIIKKIAKEILDGRIEIRPYYSAKEKSTPCRFCSYKSICQFNPKFKGNNYRYVPNKKKQDILDEIKGE